MKFVISALIRVHSRTFIHALAIHSSQAKQDLQARISAQLLSILLPVMRRLSEYLRNNRIRRGF